MADSMMEWSVRDAKEQIASGSVMMDGWELKKLLGRGGFGDVWLAEKKLLGVQDQSAIKIIRIPRDPDEIKAMRAEGFSGSHIQAEFRRSVENAVREIRTMIDLRSHPAIVICESFDVIQYEEDESWEIDIRMQLLTPLADWAEAQNVKQDDVIRMGISLSDLLSVCEKKNILHRDIKPANIFVDQLSNFKLGDFGLARVISEAGSTHSKGVGTEAFMAPEVFVSGKYDHRADLYSLGLVMYWMLNNQSLPFTGESGSRSQAISRRLSGETIRALPGVDPELDRIIRKACETDPEKRWKTAKEFHDALVRLQYKKNVWDSEPEMKEPEAGKKKTEPEPAVKKKPEQPVGPGDLQQQPNSVDLPSNPGRPDIDSDYSDSGEKTVQDNKQIRLPEKSKAADLKSKETQSPGAKIAIIALLFVLIAAAVWGQSNQADRKPNNTFDQTSGNTAAVEEVAREAKYAPYRTPGNIVVFGCYEQDNNAAKGPEEIEWIVLDYDEKENKALLLSRYGLDAKPYNTEYVETTWEKCTLRSWLNGEFLQSAFSAKEQAAILTTEVDNSASQGYSKWNTDGGNNTQDQIFLLSYAEANRYLSVTYYDSDNARARVNPTAYAITNGAVTNRNYQTADGDSAGWWWLRSPGGLRNYVADVGTGGSLGYFNVRHAGTVRPAFWVNLESEIIPTLASTPTPAPSSVSDADSENSENSVADREAKYATYRTPGSIVTFGRYEQNNNTANGQEEIEWIVLDYDEEENKALLLSRYGLDAVRYNAVRTDITWEKCTLRTWLNGDFLNKAFSAAEQSAILMTNVDNSKSQGYRAWGTDGGNNTEDRIFLLSYAEANRYLGVTYDDSSNTKSRVTPTAYALAQGAYTSDSNKTEDGVAAGRWWLRSPGSRQNYAAGVVSDGSLGNDGVLDGYDVVRPAFWLNLESDIF